MLVEPAYAGTYWCLRTLAGIDEQAARRGRAVHAVEDTRVLDGGAVLIVGTSVRWLLDALRGVMGQGVHPVVAGMPPTGFLCTFVAPDYAQAMTVLAASGQADRPALFAVHDDSAADQEKRAVFERLYPGADIIGNDGDLLDASARLTAHAGAYDCVVCANDVAAMVLRRVLAGQGISPMPRLLAFGDQQLPQDEGIEVLRLDFQALGRHVVRLYLERERDVEPLRRTLWLPCHDGALLARAPRAHEGSEAARPGFYRDPQVHEMFRLKALLSCCDGLDLDILRALVAGMRYADIAETLYTTENTIKYRIRRMQTACGADGRDALVALAQGFIR